MGIDDLEDLYKERLAKWEQMQDAWEELEKAWIRCFDALRAFSTASKTYADASNAVDICIAAISEDVRNVLTGEDEE